jgi:hypothetical protein
MHSEGPSAGPEVKALLSDIANCLAMVDRWLEETATLREREGWSGRANELRSRRQEPARLRERVQVALGPDAPHVSGEE